MCVSLYAIQCLYDWTYHSAEFHSEETVVLLFFYLLHFMFFCLGMHTLFCISMYVLAKAEEFSFHYRFISFERPFYCLVPEINHPPISKTNSYTSPMLLLS